MYFFRSKAKMECALEKELLTAHIVHCLSSENGVQLLKT